MGTKYSRPRNKKIMGTLDRTPPTTRHAAHTTRCAGRHRDVGLNSFDQHFPTTQRPLHRSLDGFHAQRIAKALVLDARKTLREDISRHIVGPDESEVDHTIGDAFSNKMILYVDVFSRSMVDRVSGEEIGCMIVDV